MCLTAAERKVKICERNRLRDSKVSAGEGGGAPDTAAEIPLQPRFYDEAALPLQPMELHRGDPPV